MLYTSLKNGEMEHKNQKKQKQTARYRRTVPGCLFKNPRECICSVPLCRKAAGNISDADHFFFFLFFSDLYTVTRLFSFTPVSWVSSTGPEWKRSCSR